MSYTEEEIVTLVSEASVERLQTWVREGLVRPTRRGERVVYAEVDLARVRLLCQLTDELEIPEDATTVVVSLLDQVHGLRRELLTLARAVERQPQTIRARIAEAMRELYGAEEE